MSSLACHKYYQRDHASLAIRRFIASAHDCGAIKTHDCRRTWNSGCDYLVATSATLLRRTSYIGEQRQFGTVTPPGVCGYGLGTAARFCRGDCTKRVHPRITRYAISTRMYVTHHSTGYYSKSLPFVCFGEIDELLCRAIAIRVRSRVLALRAAGRCVFGALGVRAEAGSESRSQLRWALCILYAQSR